MFIGIISSSIWVWLVGSLDIEFGRRNKVKFTSFVRYYKIFPSLLKGVLKVITLKNGRMVLMKLPKINLGHRNPVKTCYNQTSQQCASHIWRKSLKPHSTKNWNIYNYFQ